MSLQNWCLLQFSWKCDGFESKYCSALIVTSRAWISNYSMHHSSVMPRKQRMSSPLVCRNLFWKQESSSSTNITTTTSVSDFFIINKSRNKLTSTYNQLRIFLKTHMRSPPEEPHLAWVDVLFLGDFSCLSWASITCNWAEILICWCQSLRE